MPAPRVSPEAASAAIVFLINDGLSSEWLRCYFTLELALSTSVYWVLGEWDSSGHKNLGAFKLEPTLENFLTTVVAEGKRRWC
ncbi:hypothetical protein [Microseira wollei]|uniref:Transposase n=1 Tax=Microseira wollei NIES-4236 TaxID=2530354 RepID=A0AAV3XKL0_9CYAN|nr:hypothetical protein [Microseira wollei]GET40032.1 hypothetical protein MiSe_48400 [Microseira wollei NIES-4236]